jgi:hypothetical protein
VISIDSDDEEEDLGEGEEPSLPTSPFLSKQRDVRGCFGGTGVAEYGEVLELSFETREARYNYSKR